MDYVWAAVVTKHYLDGIHENYAPDQAADTAVKRADQAEGVCDQQMDVSTGNPNARLDLLWALVAADEFNRLLGKTIEPSGRRYPRSRIKPSTRSLVGLQSAASSSRPSAELPLRCCAGLACDLGWTAGTQQDPSREKYCHATQTSAAAAPARPVMHAGDRARPVRGSLAPVSGRRGRLANPAGVVRREIASRFAIAMRALAGAMISRRVPSFQRRKRDAIVTTVPTRPTHTPSTPLFLAAHPDRSTNGVTTARPIRSPSGMRFLSAHPRMDAKRSLRGGTAALSTSSRSSGVSSFSGTVRRLSLSKRTSYDGIAPGSRGGVSPTRKAEIGRRGPDVSTPVSFSRADRTR
jgi:hypothetical protein